MILIECFSVKIAECACLKCYLHHQSTELRRNRYEWQPKLRPAVLILPGGGYLYIADSESDPIAITYLRAGYNTFVLEYSVGDASEYPQPLVEAALSLYYIREHSVDFNIDVEKIAVCGLSAGAHLAGMIATQWKLKAFHTELGIPYGMNRPNALILAYPLIDLRLFNAGDEDKGKKFGKMLWDECKNVNTLENICTDTPPMFIWCTRDDPIIPSNQSLQLACRLSEKDIPYELHVFHIGDHGLSTCDNLSLYGKYGLRDYPINVKQWTSLSINWLNALFLFDEYSPDKYK